jgi:HlyD family secretion protein
MKKIVKISIGVIILGLFVYTIVFLYNKSKDKPEYYETKNPFISNVIRKTVATGSVQPRREIEIKPTVSGIVEQIFVEPGQKVKKGDLIARVKIIPDMISLNNAESRFNRAKLNFEDSRLSHDRQKRIFEQGVIPEAEFLQSKLTFNTAREEMEAAENNLQLIREGVVKKSGQATNTLIRSTIDGMILDVPIEVGNSVIEANTFNAGTTIALVANMSEMIFKGKVDETEVGKIKEGMGLLLSVGAIDSETFDAELEYIAPKGKEENGAIQFEIRAKVELKEGQFIRSGYSANADIVLARRDSVLVIEESLISFEGDTAYVEIETTTPQVFEKKKIEIGLSDGVNIEVLEGVIKEDKLKGKKTEAPGKDKKA